MGLLSGLQNCWAGPLLRLLRTCEAGATHDGRRRCDVFVGRADVDDADAQVHQRSGCDLVLWCDGAGHLWDSGGEHQDYYYCYYVGHYWGGGAGPGGALEYSTGGVSLEGTRDGLFVREGVGSHR